MALHPITRRALETHLKIQVYDLIQRIQARTGLPDEVFDDEDLGLKPMIDEAIQTIETYVGHQFNEHGLETAWQMAREGRQGLERGPEPHPLPLRPYQGGRQMIEHQIIYKDDALFATVEARQLDGAVEWRAACDECHDRIKEAREVKLNRNGIRAIRQMARKCNSMHTLLSLANAIYKEAWTNPMRNEISAEDRKLFAESAERGWEEAMRLATKEAEMGLA